MIRTEIYLIRPGCPRPSIDSFTLQHHGLINIIHFICVVQKCTSCDTLLMFFIIKLKFATFTSIQSTAKCPFETRHAKLILLEETMQPHFPPKNRTEISIPAATFIIVLCAICGLFFYSFFPISLYIFSILSCLSGVYFIA